MGSLMCVLLFFWLKGRTIHSFHAIKNKSAIQILRPIPNELAYHHFVQLVISFELILVDSRKCEPIQDLKVVCKVDVGLHTQVPFHNPQHLNQGIEALIQSKQRGRMAPCWWYAFSKEQTSILQRYVRVYLYTWCHLISQLYRIQILTCLLVSMEFKGK